MARVFWVALILAGLVQGQTTSEILYGRKGSLDARMKYDPDLLDNLLKKDYPRIVDEDWSRFNQMQVFLAFADAKCQVPEGRQTAAAAAWLHQGYFAGEPDSNAIGLDSLGLQATGRLQKNYQEALVRFAAQKCESPYTQNVFESLVELINKRRAATPNGTPAPNEPPPFRQVLDRFSFDKLKEALESWQKRRE